MVALAGVPPCTGAQATGLADAVGVGDGAGGGDGVGEASGVVAGEGWADGDTLGFADALGVPPGGTEPQAKSRTASATSAATLMSPGLNTALRHQRVIRQAWFGTFGPRTERVRRCW